MELIGKQIAIETILGQPPELHYPSWYARQIEDLPPVEPERTQMQELLDVTADRDYWKAQCHSYEMTINRITESAQPERIRGHWVNGRCDKCNEHAPFWAMASTYYESNFCPNCGADMRGEQDG